MRDTETQHADELTLAEVCEFIADCLHKTAPTQSTGYPSIRTPNVGRGRLKLDGVNRVSGDVYVEWTKRAIPEPGDLIMAREAPAGNVAIIEEGQTVCLGQRTVHLRPNRTNVDPYFLCYYLLAPRQQGALLASETGATARHVNMRDIRRLKLGSLPTLPTQRKLGQTIAAYDDLIANNARRIALLEESARLLYREWFMYLRFPGHEHLNIKDGIPDGWDQLCLGEIATIRKGKNITKATAEEGGMPVVAGGLKPAYYHSIANAIGPVVTVSASGANAGYVALYLTDIWASDCSYLSASENPEIWFLYLSMKSRQTEITRMQQGAAQPHVYPKQLKRLRLLYPAVHLRNIFRQSVDASFSQIAILQEQSQRLLQARDLLLPRLMNGQITV